VIQVGRLVGRGRHGLCPTSAGFAAANDLVGKSDIEVREAIGEKFPKHIYH